MERVERQNGVHTIEAAELGFGTREYGTNVGYGAN